MIAPLRNVKQLWRNYRMRAADFDAMFASQGGRCAVCHEVRELHVDHCHSSGLVRGLLCVKCNTGLGKFADSLVLLERAAAYLVAWREAYPDYCAGCIAEGKGRLDCVRLPVRAVPSRDRFQAVYAFYECDVCTHQWRTTWSQEFGGNIVGDEA